LVIEIASGWLTKPSGQNCTSRLALSMAQIKNLANNGKPSSCEDEYTLNQVLPIVKYFSLFRPFVGTE
jgi:hypothetical protein